MMRLFRNKKAEKLQRELDFAKHELLHSLAEIKIFMHPQEASSYTIPDLIFKLRNETVSQKVNKTMLEELQNECKNLKQNSSSGRLEWAIKDNCRLEIKLNNLESKLKQQQEKSEKSEKEIKQKDKIIEELTEQKMKYIEFIRNIKR